MYGSDFLHTWDKTTDELKALYATAAALRNLRERNISSKIFDSGLAVSLFRDNSTRTRFTFSKASNLHGLELQDLDEKKSQIAHGETVRETDVYKRQAWWGYSARRSVRSRSLRSTCPGLSRRLFASPSQARQTA